MSYRGRIKIGVFVLDDPVQLPDGTEVWVDLQSALTPESAGCSDRPTLGEKLLKYAGCISDLPPDLARNHDHYLYGTPSRY